MLNMLKIFLAGKHDEQDVCISGIERYKLKEFSLVMYVYKLTVTV